jgi:hypothetical protein
MEKIKFLEFEITEGNILFIPSYWWYSIKYTSDDNTLISSFTYNSVMSCIANCVDIGKYYLQQNNIKTRITKTMDIQVSSVPIETEKENDTDKTEKSSEKENLTKQIQDIVL